MSQYTDVIALYIHIPFCIKKCPYCAFYKELHTEEKEKKFILSLKNEISSVSNYFQRPTVNSIFFGGGTPNVLSKSSLESIFTMLYSMFDIVQDCEITMELNPERITDDQLNHLHHLSVNRISLGIQSLSLEELQFLGRRHSPEEAIKSIETCIESPIKNINIDIIFSTPKTTLFSLENTLSQILSYPIPHISSYALTIEKGTVFSKRNIKAQVSDIERTQHEFIINKLAKNEVYQYEISAFSKRGYECRHNLSYWQFKSFIGLGPSASSFIMWRRFTNTSSLFEYFQEPVQLVKYLKTSQPEPLHTLKAEFIIAQLRLIKGLDLQLYELLFLESFEDRFQKELKDLDDNQMITLTSTHLVVQPDYIFLVDSICLQLIENL